MGVPKFFRWISERYPCLSELVREYQLPTFDNLYLDMNGIIHTCSHPNDFDPHFRITEEKIFKDIFHYIEVLFRMIRPQKVFFMAVDGVAPRAKMNQQRGRRFRSAKEAEVLEKKAVDKGENLPHEARFDSNCITPGTEFMARLHEQLKYFVTYKVSTDPLWQKCKIILSGHETPGEGEHKIMDYIRFLKSQENYDPNTRHCLYGLDADLIMLGLCSHEPHFSLLREEVKFVRTKQKRTTTPEEQTFYLLHLSLLREYLEMEFQSLKDNLPFSFDLEKIVDDWVLMGFLVGNDFIPPLPDMHISNGALPILYEAYIQVLPTLGGYINEGGTLNLGRFQKYMEKLSAFDIDQFKETYADLKYFEGKTGRKLGSKERTSYKSKDSEVATLSDIANLIKEGEKPVDGIEGTVSSEQKTVNPGTNEMTTNETLENSEVSSKECLKAPVKDSKPDQNGKKMNRELEALIKETEEMLLDGVSTFEDFDDLEDDDDEYEDIDDEDDDNFYLEFHQHKRDYYMNKLEYSIVNEEVLRSQAEGYVRAIQWNLNYYYNGICSWSWFYPHHYAPYISDIRNFSDLKLEFDMGMPFLPFQQLLAVLPAASKKLLPEPYRSLMINTKSPIIEYYPEKFKTDLNGKKQEWEAVVLIPFIDEAVLLEAMEPIKKLLSPEEQKRNSHGPALVYEYTEEDLGCYPAPEYFPDLSNHHASISDLHIEDLRVDPSKLVKGLCPGVKLEVYFPGFPTFKHLKYSCNLEKRKVKVFDMPSRGDNMIVHIKNESIPDPKQLATDLLGKSVFVDWPHLSEAKVTAVVSKNMHYSLAQESSQTSSDERTGLIEEEVKEKMISFWSSAKNGISERYMNRLGINVGKTEVLLQCLPIVGRQYIFGKNEKISLDKQWSKVPCTFALQTVVKDIAVHDASFTNFCSVEEVFPVGSRVILLGHPYYGYTGEVKDYEEESHRSGRVKITVTATLEPDFLDAKIKHSNFHVNYMPGGTAAQRLGISPHLLSRITGTIYIVHGKWEDGNDLKTNIGLNLKFNKKNEEVPGYTKKSNGIWLYSCKAVEAVASYMEKFPELFDYLTANIGNDIFDEATVFPNSKETLSAIGNWLKTQPFYDIERQVCGAIVLEPEIIQEIEKKIDSFYQTKHSVIAATMQVKPNLLFKPSMQVGCLPPDPGATYRLFDRVVSVKESFTVPLGWKGTITGIHEKEKDADTMYDVVFDKPFAGGVALNCSVNRGYRVPRYALINLTHGVRLRQEQETIKEKPDKKLTASSAKNIVASSSTYSFSPAWMSSPQQRVKEQSPSAPSPPTVNRVQNVVSSHPNSAFASWRNQGTTSFAQSFSRSFHSSSIPPQAGTKASSSWRQPPTEAVQKKPFPRQPAHPQQQFRASEGQMLLNENPNRTPNKVQSSQELLKTHPPAIANSSSANEFQVMWSELQGLSKPGIVEEPPKTATPAQQPQPQEAVANDSGTEILKKMLRIPEPSPIKPQTVSSPQTSKQVSVQEMFEQARANETKKAPTEECSYTLQLMKMFQLQGVLPRYNYSESKDHSIIAQVILPSMRTFTGASASTKQQAGENAAKVALNQMTSERNSFQGKMNSSVGISGPRPLTNNLPSPPQQWCWPQNQQRQNRFHQQEFHQTKQDWRVRNEQVPSYGSQLPSTWIRQHPLALPPQPYSPYATQHVQQQIRTPPRTNWRDEGRQNSQFVPLQAVKKQRRPQQSQQQCQLQPQWPKEQLIQKSNGTNEQIKSLQQKQQSAEKLPEKSNKDSTSGKVDRKENFPVESTKANIIPESSKPKTSKPRQKKSRIAANFGGVKPA